MVYIILSDDGHTLWHLYTPCILPRIFRRSVHHPGPFLCFMNARLLIVSVHRLLRCAYFQGERAERVPYKVYIQFEHKMNHLSFILLVSYLYLPFIFPLSFIIPLSFFYLPCIFPNLLNRDVPSREGHSKSLGWVSLVIDYHQESWKRVFCLQVFCSNLELDVATWAYM